MNPSEFERTKPVNTHRKIKELEKLIKEEQVQTINFLDELGETPFRSVDE